MSGPNKTIKKSLANKESNEENVKFSVGQDVLFNHKDGRFYLGTVIEVDSITERCLLRFGDNTESWSLFKDLSKLNSSNVNDNEDDEDDIQMCVICKKTSSKNLIIVCDKCNRGYHKKCHRPSIKVDSDDETWLCQKCKDSRKDEILSDDNECSDNELTLTSTQFPYDVESLTWDTYHRKNSENKYCYCGKNGTWFMQMLQCARCRQWFHQRCIACLRYPLYLGDRFYIFACRVCNKSEEFLRRLEMKWVDLVHLLLFNLTILNPKKKYFDFNQEFLPYINNNWHALELPDKIKQVPLKERKESVLYVLNQNPNRFRCLKESKKSTSSYWCLTRTNDVSQIPPAPCVTLPLKSKITETSLKQWYGSRRLQFLPLSDENKNRTVIKFDEEMLDIMVGKSIFNGDNNDSLSKRECASKTTSSKISSTNNKLIRLGNKQCSSSNNNSDFKSSCKNNFIDLTDFKSTDDNSDKKTSNKQISNDTLLNDNEIQFTDQKLKTKCVVQLNSGNNTMTHFFDGECYVKRSIPFPKCVESDEEHSDEEGKKKILKRRYSMSAIFSKNESKKIEDFRSDQSNEKGKRIFSKRLHKNKTPRDSDDDADLTQLEDSDLDDVALIKRKRKIHFRKDKSSDNDKRIFNQELRKNKVRDSDDDADLTQLEEDSEEEIIETKNKSHPFEAKESEEREKKESNDSKIKGENKKSNSIEFIDLTLSEIVHSDTNSNILPPTPPHSFSGPPTPPASNSNRIKNINSLSSASSTTSSSAESNSDLDSFKNHLNNKDNNDLLNDTSGDEEVSTKSTAAVHRIMKLSGAALRKRRNTIMEISPAKKTIAEQESAAFYSLPKSNTLIRNNSANTTDHILENSNLGLNRQKLMMMMGASASSHLFDARLGVNQSFWPSIGLSPVMPMVKTLKRQLSEKDICIGPNGEVKRKRQYRKMRRTDSNEKLSANCLQRRNSISSNADTRITNQENDSNTIQQQTQPECLYPEYMPTVVINGRRLRQRPEKQVNTQAEVTTSNNQQQNKLIKPQMASLPKQFPLTNQSIFPIAGTPFPLFPSTNPFFMPTNPFYSPNQYYRSEFYQNNVKELKEMANEYFGSVNRIRSGEKFTIKGRRLTNDGKVEYLIEFERSILSSDDFSIGYLNNDFKSAFLKSSKDLNGSNVT